MLPTFLQFGARAHQREQSNNNPRENNDENNDVEADVAAVPQITALDRALYTAQLDRMKMCTDFDRYLTKLEKRLIPRLEKKLVEYHGIKVQVIVEAEYEKRTPSAELHVAEENDEEEEQQQQGGSNRRTTRAMTHARRARAADEPVQPPAPRFVTGFLTTTLMSLMHASMLPGVANAITRELQSRHVNFIREGSGLVLRQIIRTELKIARHTPLSGSAYAKLPVYLEQKKAIVNVKNTDNRCFGYALLAAISNMGKNATRAGTYDSEFARYGLDTLEYPVSLDNLAEIEEQIQIPFNVYSFFDDEGKGRYPVFTSRISPDEAIDLLHWSEHFGWIKNFSRFMGGFTKHKGTLLWCKRCLGHFRAENAFKLHKQCCRGMDGCTTVFQMPIAGTKVAFQHIKYQTRASFVIYADFECLTVPTEDAAFDDWQHQQQHSQTSSAGNKHMHSYQEHTPISVGLKLVSSVAGVLDNEPYLTHTGNDVVEWFLSQLIVYEAACVHYFFDERRLIMTEEDKQNHEAASVCYICKYPFAQQASAKGGAALSKVRDHDHITGAYRGAAHSRCNLQLRRTYKIPVFIHNFRGYDSHLLVRALGKFKTRQVSVIGQTMEKYITMGWGEHLAFKDSLQFLSCSLDGLVNCLRKSGRDKFKHLISAFEPAYGADCTNLLLRKGVYPYDYMGNADRLEERALPPREAFASRLKQEECSVEEHQHAQRVWDAFKCERFLDYHNLYLKTDVLLLADVFESFRSTALQNYGLDPAHYISAPQLSWDAMLKMTECELELLSDPAMFQMLHDNLRGGVAMISKRHAHANNKYMGTLYDPSEPSTYILYLDANNLYGWSMSEPMPDRDFVWLPDEQAQSIDWLAQLDDQEYGYIVECDLDYPRELHDLHNDYPLAPQRMAVASTLLSTAQKDARTKYNIAASKPTAKLVPNLMDKQRYACHYRNLKFYIQHGLILRKVHRVMRFHQSQWLHPYIAKNSALRAATADEFEKAFLKLLNNSVFGKTCENVTKRADIRLLTDSKKCQALIQKPHCAGFKIFSEDIAAVAMKKLTCAIDKPTYVGFVVLELAKLCMYEFHYNYAQKRWPDGACKLLLTDTDSLVYEITTDDVYADISAPDSAPLFDLSNYRNELRSDVNKMVIGKMKDEAAGQIIMEVVALRAKMYSYKTLVEVPLECDDEPQYKESKRAKGIQRAAMQHIQHADYLNQLREPLENYITTHRIGQQLHNVFTYEMPKRGLCSFDDKRYLLEDGINTLAHGHWRIAEKYSGGLLLTVQPAPPSSPPPALVLDDAADWFSAGLDTLARNAILDDLAGCDLPTILKSAAATAESRMNCTAGANPFDCTLATLRNVIYS